MIDLHELVLRPGTSMSFRRELSTERLDFPAVLSYEAPPVGEGVIVNSAGALSLTGTMRADMRCRCDRCAREFDLRREINVETQLADQLQDEEDPDYFLLEGDKLDIDDLLESAFILSMDQQRLCREDCKGLCPRCGADLNDGPCGCKTESDPRLAVLEQLLDDIDQTN